MKKSVEEKIRDLMAKATDQSASKDEAEGALRMARKLMDKYDVTEEDIKRMGEAAFKEWALDGRETKFGTAFHPVDKYCGRILGLFCGCKAWIHRTGGNGPDRFVYFGVESDVEFASYLRAALIKHFDVQWEIYAMDHRRVKDRAGARQSFSKGFANALQARLDDWMHMRSEEGKTVKTDSNALVLKRLDIVEQELQRRGYKFGHGKGTKSYGQNMTAAGAGLNAGNSASVGRGIGGNGPKQITAR